MDVRPLTHRRPTGQRAQQIVSGYVSLNQPAPQYFSDPLFVVIPSLLTGQVREFPGGTWPICQGDLLPGAGTLVVLAYDERGVLCVLTWGGQYIGAT